MRPLRVEPGQDRRPGGGERRADRAHRLQHAAERGRVQRRGTRVIEVIHRGLRHPQRLSDTRRPLLISDAHPGSPPPRRITVPGPPGTYTLAHRLPPALTRTWHQYVTLQADAQAVASRTFFDR